MKRHAAVMFLALGMGLAPHSRGAEPVDVWIFGGQSNMVGSGADGSVLTNSLDDPDILWWELAGTWDFASMSPVEPAYDTGGWSTLDSWGGFGPHMGFLRTLYVEGGYDAPDAPKLAGFKFAWNGTSVQKRWILSLDNSLLEAMVPRFEQAMQELRLQGYLPRIRGVVGMWCEGDTNHLANEADQAAFEVTLATFVSNLRQQLAGGRDIPMIWGRINDWDPLSSPFYPSNPARFEAQAVGWPLVRAAQANVFSADVNAYLQDTDDAARPEDDIHFTSSGKEWIGVQMAQAYLMGDSVSPLPAASESWVQDHFSGLTAESLDWSADSDGDGLTHWQEFNRGSDPHLADASPQIEILNPFSLRFSYYAHPEEVVMRVYHRMDSLDTGDPGMEFTAPGSGCPRPPDFLPAANPPDRGTAGRLLRGRDGLGALVTRGGALR